MNPSRLFLVVVAGCCLFSPGLLPAQVPPFTPDKQYSADEVITMKDGNSITVKTYLDNGKIRSQMNTHGMDVVSIIRPDEKKMYSIMPAQKMVMEMSLDPEKMKAKMPPMSADDAKFELVGPDVVDGAACTKYKATSKDNRIFFWWINDATKAPVKMTSEDGSFTVVWKNYKAGPQDAALFEPPAGYQVMAMPSGMGMPGGGGQ